MTPQEYIEKALRTESKDQHFPEADKIDPRVEHAIMGMVTESGELLDNIKKTKFYGRTFDKTNLVDEAGDVMWYLAILCDALEISFEELWEKNIKKLQQRYPDKFTADKALNRDLDAERRALEG